MGQLALWFVAMLIFAGTIGWAVRRVFESRLGSALAWALAAAIMAIVVIIFVALLVILGRQSIPDAAKIGYVPPVHVAANVAHPGFLKAG